MSIREKLIQILGGYTYKEMREINYNSMQIGKLAALEETRAYMRECNGEEAETWCDMVWQYVCRRIEKLKQEYI